MEWIEKIIRINSVTHHSNDELVRYLWPLLEDAGLKVDEQKIVENGETFRNLIAFSHSPSAPDLLVFNTHLDTVSGGEASAWTKTAGNPFRATRVRDRIYGLGTADVKIDFLCKLWAARMARPWQRPFALVGTYGEERGLIGAAKLLTSGKIKPKYALVGEPSNLELIYAHKGHLIFTFLVDLKGTPAGAKLKKVWKGKSAHSSTPELGDNALRKGLTDIFKRGYGILSLQAGIDSNKVPDLCEADVIVEKTEGTKKLFALITEMDELERELKKRRDTRFSPSSMSLSLNRAVTRNGELQLTFDIRTLPDTNSVRLKERLESIGKKTGCNLISLSIDEALRGQKNGKLMVQSAQALKEIGVKVVKKTKASSTEAALYQAHGAEAIVFGPGLSVGNVHRPNEYNSLRQISLATRFYSTLLKMQSGATI